MPPFLLLIALGGCSGAIMPPQEGALPDDVAVAPNGGTTGSTAPGPGPTAVVNTPTGPCEIKPGPAPLRPLSEREYNNTLADLLGLAEAPHVQLPDQPGALFVQRAFDEAELRAKAVAAAPAKLLGCDPSTGDVCTRPFVTRFGKRAFRRPLTVEETSRFMAVFASEPAPATGVEQVVRALLQSPHFLYRPELGLPSSAARLSPWEVASRLSYLVLRSMPDDGLFAAAESGALLEPAEVARQIERLLPTDRARATVAEFHQRWLAYEDLANLEHDVKAYPAWQPGIAERLAQETTTFLEHAFFDGPGGARAILDAPYSYLDPTLARFYGVPAPSGSGFSKVMLDGKRMGVLSHAGLMALNAYTDQTSPIHRGLLVRTRLFCEHIPDPPATLVPVVPPPVAGETSRERFDKISKAAGCSGCHQLFSPIGNAFEGFDAVGLHRASDSGRPVDDSGEIRGTDAEGSFVGVRGLVDKLVASQQVKSCLVGQWFQFALGRDRDEEGDACVSRHLTDVLDRSGGDLRRVLIALVQTPSFLQRPPVAP